MQPDLATLVGSRICHDLISPIGAIGNGLELLSLTGGQTSAEMDLISDSVQNANARIRFYRIAYGAAGPEQRLSAGDILPVFAALARAGRCSYHWHVPHDQPRREVRCALLLVQCLESAMPLGGEVHVRLTGETWVISAVAPRFRVDQPLWDQLRGASPGFSCSAAQVQFALLPGFMAEAGRDLQIDIGDDGIAARF